MEYEWLLTTLILFSISMIAIASFQSAGATEYSVTSGPSWGYYNVTEQIKSKVETMHTTVQNATEPSYTSNIYVWNPLSTFGWGVAGALQLLMDVPNLVANIITDFGGYLKVPSYVAIGLMTIVSIGLVFAFLRSFLKARV